jgi:hypothetical protein
VVVEDGPRGHREGEGGGLSANPPRGDFSGHAFGEGKGWTSTFFRAARFLAGHVRIALDNGGSVRMRAESGKQQMLHAQHFPATLLPPPPLQPRMIARLPSVAHPAGQDRQRRAAAARRRSFR